MRVRLPLLMLATLVVASTELPAAERPPQNLHRVGDHWTAWDPPTPPAGVEVHVIVAGDTLWDLAAQHYGDPYLWPQLWERNRYILDAHWIYPGDPLVLGPEVAPVDELAEAPVGVPEESPGAETEASRSTAFEPKAENGGAPVPLGFESDVYCQGYIGDLEEEFPYSLVGSEYQVQSPDLAPHGVDVAGWTREASTVKFDLSVGDIVYIDGGRVRGLIPGSVFEAVSPASVIGHPVTGEAVGRYYRNVGRVRVLSVQDETAIAEIVHACDPIRVGVRLRPFEPVPIPLGRSTSLRPVNFPPPAEALEGAPVILYAKDDIVSLFEDHVVHIDRGAIDGVTPGDFYTIYRDNRPGFPPLVIGELAVLAVHETTSLARIVEGRTAIYVGDRLQPK
jgi:hypothetical protein